MKPMIVITAILVAAFRPVLLFHEFNPHIEASYQAFAHMLVGYLFAVWMVKADIESRRWFWFLAAVEIVCAGLKISGVFA